MRDAKVISRKSVLIVIYPETMLPKADRELIQIVDAATADAARRSGDWLKCRPGCTQCCIGVFAISQLDAMRLREGLAQLQTSDPERAAAVRLRAADSRLRLSDQFPGDTKSGMLDDAKNEADQERFDSFANSEPCPVLDPNTGTCDLYGHRPMTCRVFGPPIRSQEGIGVCELCFDGASEEEILAAELNTDWASREDALIAEAERVVGLSGKTIVAFALTTEPPIAT
jgi:Fe-S-cluster containining protein